MRYILLLLFLTGCGGSSGGGGGNNTPDRPYQPLVYSVPIEVDQYVRSFKLEAEARGIVLPTNLIVRFVDSIESDPHSPLVTWGYCQMGENAPEITLTMPIWNSSSDIAKELLLFHELGHCWLGLDHTGSIFSIMNPSIMNTGFRIYYQSWRTQMIDELFGLVEPHDYAQDLVE